MKTIIITGPSGSGKSILSEKLSRLFSNTIVIKTDSYYRDSKFIKFLSILISDLYDRPLSIKKRDLMNNLKSIDKRERFIITYHYEFKSRQSIKKKMDLNYKIKDQFLIVEGIFAHRLDINYKGCTNIICTEDKEICLQRRMNRDQNERGRNIKEVNRKFFRSWNLFYQNIEHYRNNNETIILNPSEKGSYDELLIKLNNISKKN